MSVNAAAAGAAILGQREEALVSWSAIAEPGDPLARALVGVLGPAEALAWVRRAAGDPVAATMDLAPRARRELVERAVAAVARWVPRLADSDPGRHVERAAAVGAVAIPRGATGWPTVLDDLGDAAPYCLWVRGAVPADEALARAVAVVGSRSSTAYGEHMAATIASGLADEGWTVVSGGAYGIDARAHRGSLAAGGVTVAVLAGGVDRLYPRGNADLLAKVLDTGAVIAEQPPGFPPHRSRFLTRNRIIAAARATVVVEAAYRSGALSTATHAAEIGRPVAAVPGPATNPSSFGCHRLIREGAALVTSARDVLDLVLPLDASRAETGPPAPLGHAIENFASADERRAFDAVSRRGSGTGQVARTAGMTPAEARAALASLEVAGAVVRAGDLWTRAPRRR